MNPILYIDGYKLDHRRQYPPGTEMVYANWTPRRSRVDGQAEVAFFGLQYALQKYFAREMQDGFFSHPRDAAVEKYKRRVDGYLGPEHGIDFSHIADLHRLGHIPLEFSCLPEGSRVPMRVPMFTVHNTHRDFAWCTNYFETLLSSALWLACTSATTAYRYRTLLNDAATRTGGPLGFVAYQGHDFSVRGMPGIEAAAISGAGHSLSFSGTDNLPALDLIDEYYGPIKGAEYASDPIGVSVPATEHSVMCAGGRENEAETIGRVLDLYPTGIVSVVSDTWDLWHVLANILPLPEIRERILGRQGTYVTRPDSGDPALILCGNPTAQNPHERRGVIPMLYDIFGGVVNARGFKQLDPHVGSIYGDAITYEKAREIVERLEAQGFASTNCVLGIGSYTYQHVTRDTYGFALKTTWVCVNGEGRDIYKSPATDSGEKHSARGRLRVVIDSLTHKYALVDGSKIGPSMLVPTWSNGMFLRRQTFKDVRRTLFSPAGHGIVRDARDMRLVTAGEVGVGL